MTEYQALRKAARLLRDYARVEAGPGNWPKTEVRDLTKYLDALADMRATNRELAEAPA